MVQVFIDTHGLVFFFSAATLATASTKRQTLHSTAEVITTTDMTTDIISPFTWSSAPTHTQQPTRIKLQSTTPTSSESFVTSTPVQLRQRQRLPNVRLSTLQRSPLPQQT